MLLNISRILSFLMSEKEEHVKGGGENFAHIFNKIPAFAL